MSMKPIIVVGAGGHGAVVADALLLAGEKVLGFTDQNLALHGKLICGIPVLGSDEVLLNYKENEVLLANGIGSLSNETESVRQQVQRELESSGWSFCTVIHPTAIISRYATIGISVQLMAGSIVQAGAYVGDSCIVNTGAIIEHDAIINSWCHVSSGAVICGHTKIGAGSHVGAGSTVIQCISIGPETLIGAGAVVLKNFEGHGTLVGVPSKQVERCKDIPA